jgi:DoxX-like family
LSAAPEQGFIMSNLVATDASSVSAARWPVWIGRALSGLVILFLLMDASMKIAALTIVSESAVMIGWTGDPGFWRAMGLLLLAITALYAWPQTAVLGAILLTGYLGGAVAAHLRMSDPLFSHTLFGVYLGIALWGGLWLRDARIRNLLPIS